MGRVQQGERGAAVVGGGALVRAFGLNLSSFALRRPAALPLWGVCTLGCCFFLNIFGKGARARSTGGVVWGVGKVQCVMGWDGVGWDRKKSVGSDITSSVRREMALGVCKQKEKERTTAFSLCVGWSPAASANQRRRSGRLHVYGKRRGGAALQLFQSFLRN